MNTMLYVKSLEMILTGYSTGDFTRLATALAENCTWDSDWKQDILTQKTEIEKYYLRKGEILNRGKDYPVGYVVELFGTEDCLDGKGLYMNQNCYDKSFDLILRIKIDSSERISAIKLCMKELFRFRYYNATIPQY